MHEKRWTKYFTREEWSSMGPKERSEMMPCEECDDDQPHLTTGQLALAVVCFPFAISAFVCAAPFVMLYKYFKGD